MRRLRCAASLAVPSARLALARRWLQGHGEELIPEVNHPPVPDEIMETYPDAYLSRFQNHETQGVPAGAAADGPAGFPLARMRALMEELPCGFPVVHIGGSKGKGSVAALVTAALREHGLEVGLYTSPHAVHCRERVNVGKNGELAQPRLWAEHVAKFARSGIAERVEKEHGPLTHFEVLTALSLSYFQNTFGGGVDVAVVEVGLGGSRDATNVFGARRLAVAAVTALDMEHLSALGGDSIECIARAKAGIFRAGRPAIIGPQFLPGAKEALTAAASAAGVTVTDTSRFSVQPGRLPLVNGVPTPLPPTKSNARVQPRQQVVLRDTHPQHGFAVEAKLGLLGEHQCRNAETALAILAAMQLGPPPGCRVYSLTYGGGEPWKFQLRHIARGFARASLPGRFQLVQPPRKSELFKYTPVMVLDGAHTGGATRALASALSPLLAPDRKLAFVIAVASDKPLRQMLAPLFALRPAAVFATSVPVAGSSRRSAAPADIVRAWEALADEAAAADPAAHRARVEVVEAQDGGGLRAAMEAAGEAAGDGGVVCVTGSLHAAFKASELGWPATWRT